MQSLADGRFERASEQFQEEDYLVRPDLLGNSMFQTGLALEDQYAAGQPLRAGPGACAAVLAVPGSLRRLSDQIGATSY